MQTSTAIGIGVVAAIGAYLVLRPNSTMSTRTAVVQTANGPVSIQVPNYSASQVSSAMAQSRETMIQRLMTRDHLTRAQAEARYDQLVPSVSAALTRPAVSGIGNYYHS